MEWIADGTALPAFMQWFAPLAQAVVAAGVLIGISGLRKNRKLRLISYEDNFEQRYWELMSSLSPQGMRNGVSPRHDHDERIARSYFLHVESELNARAAGYITDQTWSVWSVGILAHMTGPFTKIWTRVQDEPATMQRLPELYKFMTAPVAKDPCEFKGLKKRRYCLTGSNSR